MDKKKDWGRRKDGDEGTGGWVHEGKAKRRGTAGGSPPAVFQGRAAPTLSGPGGSHPVKRLKRLAEPSTA